MSENEDWNIPLKENDLLICDDCGWQGYKKDLIDGIYCPNIIDGIECEWEEFYIMRAE
jgi:hypothetical protein